MNSREKAEEWMLEIYGEHERNMQYKIRKLTELLDQHAAEQREACAEAMIQKMTNMGFLIDSVGIKLIKDTCLNAGVEE